MKKKVILGFLLFSLIGGFSLSLSAQARSHSPNHIQHRPQAPIYRGHRTPPPPPPIRRHHIHSNYYYYSPHAIIRYNSGYYPIPRGYYDPYMYPNYYPNFGFSFGISI